MTVQQATQQLLFQLFSIYNDREARNIADLVMEKVTEWKKIDRIINKQVPMSTLQSELLNHYTEALVTRKPVQYVLNEAWFDGSRFYVDENVLIPRAETEELVAWVLEDIAEKQSPNSSPNPGSMKILDIGTGSGCIAVALKKKLPEIQLYACDISEPALNVAKKNALEKGTVIEFLQCDFLEPNERNALPVLDIIVSNPPYVPLKDKDSMHSNVLKFEPHLALFVENNDPLLFYKAIAEFAKTHLGKEGGIYVETHEELAISVKELFQSRGFQDVDVKQDMQGKNRMVKATSHVKPGNLNDKNMESENLLQQLQHSFRNRDIEALVTCFSEHYQSEQPVHPDRAFTGSQQVRKNWSAIFAAHPDFHSELLRYQIGTDEFWAEWYWRGTRDNGSELHMRGVTIFGIEDNKITWGRLYMEPVEMQGRGIDISVAEVMQGKKT